jgi:hypothetical protein
VAFLFRLETADGAARPLGAMASRVALHADSSRTARRLNYSARRIARYTESQCDETSSNVRAVIRAAASRSLIIRSSSAKRFSRSFTLAPRVSSSCAMTSFSLLSLICGVSPIEAPIPPRQRGAHGFPGLFGGHQTWREKHVAAGDRKTAGISIGGIIVIAGILAIMFWSFWIGLVIVLIGLIAFGGFARGKWY